MSIFLKLKTTLVLGICAFAFSPDFVDARVGEEKSKVEIRLFRSGGLAIKEEKSFGTNKGEVLLINLKIISIFNRNQNLLQDTRWKKTQAN